MRAVVLEAPGVPSVVDRPDPAPGPDEVVIAVESCGICGTDLHIYDGAFGPATYPLTPGHEIAGRVAAVGRGVEHLEEDVLVAVDPSLFCGHCAFCRRGRGNLCENWNAIGDTVDGAFAEYVIAPAVNVYEVGDALTPPEAAMIEPVACAVHALDRIVVMPGDDILVYGAGTMGLILGQLLRKAGGTRIHLVDRNPDRLPRADQLFADATATDANRFDMDGYDLVVDVTGAVPAIEDGFGRVRRGGTLLVFGVADAAKVAQLSPFRVYNDEINVIGSMAVCNSFGKARDLVLGGVLDIRSIVTAVRPLEEYDDAIASVRKGEGVKTQLSPTGVRV